MELLIYFALPLATILLSIVLQKILKCPILVAITFFAIYLIVAFILDILGIFDLGLGLIAAILYSIIAFITAYLIMRFCNNEDNEEESDDTVGCNCVCNNRNIDKNDIEFNIGNNRLISNNVNNRCYRRRF